MSLGSYVVNTTIELIIYIDSHVQFAENFLMRHSLLTDLTKKNIFASDTFSENYTGHCPLMSNKEIKRQRGATFIISAREQLCLK